MGGDLPNNLDLDNLQNEKSIVGLSYYSQTKLTMMALMYEYAQRLKGTGVTVNICYPGQASTSMTQSVTPQMLPGIMKILYPLFKLLVRPDGGKSAAKASRSSVYLATSVDVEKLGGIYVDKNLKISRMPKVVTDEYNRKFIWDYVNNLILTRNDHPEL